jgi:hydrogenase nickel incorporation protein HypB
MNAVVVEKRFTEHELIAKLNREQLGKAKVFAVNVVGGPGCGKTSLIDATIESLKPDIQVGVIACDVTSHRDADRMIRHSQHVVQVNTGERGTPDASDIRAGLEWLSLEDIDVLLIENVGTLIGAAEVDLGHDATAAVFSVAGGHDKAEKHADLVREADVIVLNKTDLFPAVPFDIDVFRADVRRFNLRAPICELSALKGEGMESWLQWLKTHVAQREHGDASKWFG